MANILFVVPPLTGHINPLLPLAADLAKRGHRIAWAGNLDVLQKHLTTNSVCYPLPVVESKVIEENSHKVRGLESVKFFYEQFYLPMAQICLGPLEKIVESFAPDLIICDHQMIAGALVARKMDIPWISTITTTASMLRTWEILDNWVADKLAQLQISYGLQEICERPDFSDYGCIVFSSKALVGEQNEFFDAPFHFVGPSINHNRKPIEFPWHKLDHTKQKILVSLGTVSRDRSMRFYEVMIEALKDTDYQIIMVAPQELKNEVPGNFIVQECVPQLDLIPHMDLVVSHAGHNTVCETLSHAKPMVVAPIRDDQSVIARQVTGAGAGLSVRYGKMSAKSAHETISEVLSNPSYKHHAARIKRSFAPLKGTLQAVSIVESVLMSTREATREVAYASA